MLKSSSLAKAPFIKRQIMKQRKPFSVLKWLVFPSLTLALATIIAWFNVQAFGWKDGAVYIGVVAVVTVFSIAINKYVKLIEDDDPTNDRLAVTAFVFEIVLTLALIINAAYSLSVQREMSIAWQAESAQGQSLESVSKFKDRRAQREAARMLREQSKGATSVQSIFAANERVLFWIMIGEMLAYAVAAFTLYAVSSLSGRGVAPKRAPDFAQNRPESEFPTELDVGYRVRPKDGSKLRLSPARPAIYVHSSQKTTPVATGGREGAMIALRDHLRVIASGLPNRSFKADLRKAEEGGGVWIRLYESREGREKMLAKTKQSDKLLYAVNRPDFRERLIAELVACGFPIGGER
jgi:NADH:ubiquinone oxidoreductase subunit 6 (subunit J)